jgi:hypothetical protein
MFNGAVAPSPSGPNPTMYPISDTGPYYAALVVGATLGPIFAFAYRAARAADRERAAAPAAAR